ncbi:sensor histidine kinase [Streptomyces lasiicapitis]|uniref:sensor histidine kinase n=1 Tax=Streptomyces lasiicapitis TaxID=1923961 RepID=UPI001E655603|nr:ATP-binding protein [Streptomyces lasiicapitis]
MRRLGRIRLLPTLSMRAKAALLSALLVTLPLAAGSFLATDFWRRSLLENAMETTVLRANVTNTFARGVKSNAAELPPGARQYCVSGKPKVLRTGGLTATVTPGGPDSGALSLWLWPDLIDGDGAPRTLRIVYPEYPTPSSHRLITEYDLKKEQAALDAMAQRIVGTAAGLVLLTAAVAWFIAGRTLRPMEAIRRQFTELSTHHLDQRVPVPPRNNEISRLAVTMNDTLDRLQSSVEQQRRFTANASHELRTPLAALRAELEIALAQPQNADWPQVVERALGDAVRLQQLTDDLLMLARLDAQATLFDSGKQLDLADLVREECARRTLPAHLALTVSAGQDPVPVRGHCSLLGRVLGNLLDNAERYAAQRITVCLTRDAGAGTVTLDVGDDGPGIPAEDRTRVFGYFTRLDEARSHHTGGAGLGLAIAQHIATLHHGSLTITDSDHGTHFRLTLPGPQPQREPQPPDRPHTETENDCPASAGRPPDSDAPRVGQSLQPN